MRVYKKCTSGSRGGSRALFLDQTEARREEKKLGGVPSPPPPPISRPGSGTEMMTKGEMT